MSTVASTSLDRFVEAQNPVYATVIAELTSGLKRSHWMWFVFPQLAGLGRSETARFYGIADRAEATRYWHHDVLRARLVACTRLVVGHAGCSAHTIFGSPDDLKLQSCMTLFDAVAVDEPAFGDVLRVFYDGERDATTLALLR